MTKHAKNEIGKLGEINDNESSDWKVMAIAVPTKIPMVVAILIMLSYFAVTVATIIYTHKKLEKSNNNDINSNKDMVSDNNND